MHPFQNAKYLYHLGDTNLRQPQSMTIRVEGEGVRLGAPLPAGDQGAFSTTGIFDGQGCAISEEIAIVDPLTVNVCLRADRPGGILTTNLLSLVVIEGGIVVAIFGTEDAAGRMTQEVPLSPITFGEWHSLTVRFSTAILEFFIDGILCNRETIRERLAVVLPGPTILGGWQIPNPALPEFPAPVVAMLFHRPFTGCIAYAAIWDHALLDSEIAQLSSVTAISEAIGISAADKCLADYRAFHTASRIKDITACEALGKSMRAFMAQDPSRPIYHLTAPMDGILDPAGAFFHKGKYHVFSYRNMVSLLACTPLVHFVSDDMIHWKDQPIAIWADSEWDMQGIWLANLFYDDNGIPTMLYTGLGEHGKFGILARSHDDLVSFTDKQAVITDIVHHDGHAWKEGDAWYALSTVQHWGEREGDLGDSIVLYESPDGQHWQNRGEIFHTPKHPQPMSDQQRWGFTEYPYLIPFGDKHVLMTGTRPSTYWVGKFDRQIPAFIPDDPEPKLLDHLNPFHCFNPMTVDAKGPDGSPRRIIYAMHLYTSGSVDNLRWYGVHVLPRILTRQGDRLCQEPTPEAESLRGQHQNFAGIDIQENTSGFLPGASGDALEIIATFLPGNAARFGLKVRTSEDNQSSTKIFFDVASGEVCVTDNIKIPIPYPELGHALALQEPGAAVTIRVFLDKSLFEVFINGQTLTGIFDAPPEHHYIDVFSEEGSAYLHSLDLWEMHPI